MASKKKARKQELRRQKKLERKKKKLRQRRQRNLVHVFKEKQPVQKKVVIVSKISDIIERLLDITPVPIWMKSGSRKKIEKANAERVRGARRVANLLHNLQYEKKIIENVSSNIMEINRIIDTITMDSNDTVITDSIEELQELIIGSYMIDDDELEDIMGGETEV